MGQPLEESDHISQMVRAAELYYELGLTQEEVAAHMAVSRPTVSRLLRQAREQDIVRITVVNPRSRAKRSEEHTSELQSRENLVCRLLLEKKNMIVFQNSSLLLHLN